MRRILGAPADWKACRTDVKADFPGVVPKREIALFFRRCHRWHPDRRDSGMTSARLPTERLSYAACTQTTAKTRPWLSRVWQAIEKTAIPDNVILPPPLFPSVRQKGSGKHSPDHTPPVHDGRHIFQTHVMMLEKLLIYRNKFPPEKDGTHIGRKKGAGIIAGWMSTLPEGRARDPRKMP